MYKKIYLFEVLTFLKTYPLYQSKKSSWNTTFKWDIFGIFHIVKFSYFSWRPNKVK